MDNNKLAAHKQAEADERLNGLPRGPWLTEEELQAILDCNADDEFDRLMQEKQKSESRRLSRRVGRIKTKHILRLWWAAAAVALLVLLWPASSPLADREGQGERIPDPISARILAQMDQAFALAFVECEQMVQECACDNGDESSQTIIMDI